MKKTRPAPWTTMLPPPVAKQRKWIKSASKKRQKQLAQYRKIRSKWLQNRLCEFESRGLRCSNNADDIHHLAGRSGDRLTDVKYFMAICRYHHSFIHDNPKWATEHGYLLQRI